MNYKLTREQEEKFEEYYANYKDKIKLALYKCNISPNNYNHFYSYAIEGFLQAFLIMEAGDIVKDDFPAFAYTNMKRKIIDELRRLSRENKEIAINIEDTYLNLSYQDERIEEYINKTSIIETLSNNEYRIFKYLEKGYSYKDISRLENISKSTYYNIVADIRSKSIHLLYK